MEELFLLPLIFLLNLVIAEVIASTKGTAIAAESKLFVGGVGRVDSEE